MLQDDIEGQMCLTKQQEQSSPDEFIDEATHSNTNNDDNIHDNQEGEPSYLSYGEAQLSP